MRKMLERLTIVAVAGGAIAFGAALHSAGAQPKAGEEECECIFVTPRELEWKDGPASLPAGAQFSVLRGDPGQEGPFVMRLRLPAGFRVPPHFHPADESVTVISGTFNMGKGEEFDRSDPYTLTAGSFAMIPAEDRHFAWTEEATVIQLHGMGPWRITYIDPADDPRRE